MKIVTLFAVFILCPALPAQSQAIVLEPHPRLFLRTEGTDKIPGLEELRRRLNEPYYQASG